MKQGSRGQTLTKAMYEPSASNSNFVHLKMRFQSLDAQVMTPKYSPSPFRTDTRALLGVTGPVLF